MRYHSEKPEHYTFSEEYATLYTCDHPIYSMCTLFGNEEKGLAVIRQRHDSAAKRTWWGPIDPWLIEAIYKHPKFPEYFEERAGKCTDGLYPTVAIRQIMWALKMKPLHKERWETQFDRRDI